MSSTIQLPSNSHHQAARTSAYFENFRSLYTLCFINQLFTMKFTITSVTAITALACLIDSVAAGMAYICDHKDFGGDCTMINGGANLCYNLGHMNDKVSQERYQSQFITCLGWREGEKITSYIVTGGTCRFYRHGNCVEELFAATNRQHGQLGDGHNDQISSIM